MEESGGGSETNENKVILLTIKNVIYPINTDIIYRVASRHGFVERIVIFKKKFQQAMVEFSDVTAAKNAKEVLQDKDIYDGCNTLKVEYARTQKLNVYKNDSETWDYTRNDFGASGGSVNKKSSGLLGERPEIPLAQQQAQAAQAASAGQLQQQQQQGAPPVPPQHQAPPPPPHDQTGQIMVQADYQQYQNSAYAQAPVETSNWNGRPRDDYNYHIKQSNMVDQSSVVMVYGLDPNKMNCAKLFNILCLYGNVLKIKFLKSKPNTAMVQMCTPAAVDRACQWLNGVRLFSMDLSLSKSKQLHLIDSNNSKYCLSDTSSSFVDCSNSRNHRFTSQKMAKMNRLQKPNKVLHYFNAPPTYTDSDIRQLCLSIELEPVMIKIFPPRDAQAKTSSGLLEFKSIDEAIIVLTELNHKQLENVSETSVLPQTLKLCFSSSRQ